MSDLNAIKLLISIEEYDALKTAHIWRRNSRDGMPVLTPLAVYTIPLASGARL